MEQLRSVSLFNSLLLLPVWEIIEAFHVAKRFNAPCHVHIRFDDEQEPNSNIQALEEVIAAASVSGVSLHVVHIHSMGGRSTPRLLQMISEAQSHGMDITTRLIPIPPG
jgi:hypothetical protein